MPDEVSIDNVAVPDATEVPVADEQPSIATKEAEEVKEQPASEEEAADAASDVNAPADIASPESDPNASVDSATVETQQSEASGSSEAGEAEPAQSIISLNVDTTAEDEAEAEIPPPEPVTQPSQQDQPPAAAVPTRVSLYGSQHMWCPLCRRQTQQTAESADGKDQVGTIASDALSLSWVEQSLFACNAEHHSNIIAYKSLLPPAPSLPPFVPTSLSVIGPPLSGRTSLAKRLCSSLNLTYLSIADILASLVALSDPLSTQLSASLPSPPPLSVVLDCVEAALCKLAELNESTNGWVLDGFPNTREEAEAMQQRGLLPRQCINLAIVKKGGRQAEVDEVQRRWKAREEKEQREREEQERLAAEKAAAAALEERRKAEQQAAAAAENDEEGEGGEEAGGEEAEATEQPAQPTEEQANSDSEEATAVDGGDVEEPAESENEQSAEDSADVDEAAPNAKKEAVSSPGNQPSTTETELALHCNCSVNADGEVTVDIHTLPTTPAVSIDLLTPFVDSLRATLTAEQWSEQVVSFSQLLEYLQSERLLSTITVPTSLWSAHRQANEAIAASAVARMAHLQALSAALPSSLSSLPFSSTRLLTDLSKFDLYSAVSWHERAALQKLQSDSAETRWVQHKGLLYALSNQQEEQQFITDPARYHDSSSFPTELPNPFNDDGETGQLVYPLRYMGYCPVSIQRQQAGEVLYIQPGSSKHSALYQSRLHRFSSSDALQQFLAFPARYSNLTLPSPLPLPLHLQPLPLAPDVVHSFLTLNFNARLASCLSTLSKLRHTLLYPGLSVQQSALIHLALQLRGDAVRLQAFEGECQLGREIAKEADDADGNEEVSMRHAAYDAIRAEVTKQDWRDVQKYVEGRFFPIV